MIQKSQASTPILAIVVIIALLVGLGIGYFAMPPKIVGRTVVKFYAPEWEYGYGAAKVLEAKYEEENPDIDIEVIKGPATWDAHVSRTNTWMKTDYSGVDVLYQDDVFATDGAYLGDWVDLSPYLTDEQKAMLTDFQKGYVKRWDGYYRIPFFDGFSCIYYRKDLFEEAGVTIPDRGYFTWAEFVEAAKKLTKDLDGDGTIDQWGYVTQGTPGEVYNTFNEFLHQAGGEEWELAKDTDGDGVPDTPTEPARKALQFIVDLIFKHKVMSPGIASIGYIECDGMLKEGGAAMVREWGNLAGKRRAKKWEDIEEIGVMPHPAGPAGSWGVGHCWGLVVNVHGKHKDVGIDFAKFIWNTEVMKDVAKNLLYPPPFKPLYEDKELMEHLTKKNFAMVKAKIFTEHSFGRHLPPGKSTEFHEAFGRILVDAFTGEKSVEEVLINMQKTINPLLPKE